MKDTRVRTYSAYIVCALLVLVSLPSPAQTALADLPPRPTATPTPQPAPPPATGARLELRVEFPETISYPWQDLWTVVQWQDEWGYWRTVEGWQGSLDSVAEGVGVKHWWVAKGDLGGGPFRWRVYRSQGGRLLAKSAEFDLPARTGETTTIEMSLE